MQKNKYIEFTSAYWLSHMKCFCLLAELCFCLLAESYETINHYHYHYHSLAAVIHENKGNAACNSEKGCAFLK